MTSIDEFFRNIEVRLKKEGINVDDLLKEENESYKLTHSPVSYTTWVFNDDPDQCQEQATGCLTFLESYTLVFRNEVPFKEIEWCARVHYWMEKEKIDEIAESLTGQINGRSLRKIDLDDLDPKPTSVDYYVCVKGDQRQAQGDMYMLYFNPVTDKLFKREHSEKMPSFLWSGGMRYGSQMNKVLGKVFEPLYTACQEL